MSKETISQTEGLCKEVANCIRNAYDRGYKQGEKDGYRDGQNIEQSNAVTTKEEVAKIEYERGLNAAWECARKLILSESCGGLELCEIEKIFGDGNYLRVIGTFSASECMAKIKEYEEKQKQDEDEIEVGDEILIHNIQDAETYKAVVMDIDMDKGLWIFDENACNTVIEPNRYIGEEADIEVRKTGRTYPQIAEVLEQMKGER